jgi:hypothetical protein
MNEKGENNNGRHFTSYVSQDAWPAAASLAPFEGLVMDAVWAFGRPVPVAEMLFRMQDDLRRVTPEGEKPKLISYTSVLATVNNLVVKSFLKQGVGVPRGRSRQVYTYEATMSELEYREVKYETANTSRG